MGSNHTRSAVACKTETHGHPQTDSRAHAQTDSRTHSHADPHAVPSLAAAPKPRLYAGSTTPTRSAIHTPTRSGPSSVLAAKQPPSPPSPPAPSFRSLWIMALRALLCASAVLLTIPAQAMADSAHFDITAQSLPAALKQFAEQAHMQLLYQADAVSNATGNAVSGELDKHQALEQLLNGTGLEPVYSSDTAATIRPIRAKTTSQEASGAAVVAGVGAQQVTPTQKEGKTSSSDTFRVAQADQGTPPSSAPVEKKLGSSAEVSEPRLEEVVVTAQKRTESLQVVPISAQVISSQTLTEQNHNTLEELAQVVPSVHVATGGVSNELYIRGIGSGVSPSYDQSVSTFVDDIYHGRSRMSGASFLDLDRIEVLKGPQSTFFGNNAIAGALNVVTKKPGSTFDASARALYGMFDQYALEGAIGGPITDTLGMRLAVTRNGDGRGWIENVNTGEHIPRVNNLAGRVTLSFVPNDDLDVVLKIEGSQQRTAGAAGDRPKQWVYCPPPAPLTPAWISGPFGGCTTALELGIPIGLDNNQNSQLAGVGNSLSTFEDVLTINYSKAGYTFTSVSGFLNYHFNSQSDNSLPVWGITNTAPEKYHQFSQEFRFASPAGQKFEYLAGVYFQTDRLNWGNQASLPGLNFLPSLGPPFDQLSPYLPIAGLNNYSQGEDVYSVFGSFSWTMTDRLKLNAGLRGSWVNKDGFGKIGWGYVPSGQFYGGYVPMPPDIGSILDFIAPSGQGQVFNRSDKAWMPSAGLQYNLMPEAMMYFSYSRGFLAGGFNALNPLGPPQNVEFGPEKVDAYEVGLKSTWLADRLLVNLAAFRSNYADLQVTAAVFHPELNITTYETRNAATSRSQGLELETRWLLTRDFNLAANVTYLDSHYLRYQNAPPTTLQTYCSSLSFADYSATPQCARFPFPVQTNFSDASGQPTNYAPRWSGSLTASYSLLLHGDHTLTAQVIPYFTSHYNPDPDGLYPSLGNYVRLDASLTLAGRHNHWDLDIIGKNLTDRVIVGGGSYSDTLVSKETPRSVAVQFRYRW
jgi:iron complex outermembrane recepter protein